MNAQPILTQIQQDAQAIAQKIINDANQRAAEIAIQSEHKMEAMREQTQLMAQKESDALEERMGRMAELEERKTLLQKKRKLIDEAFALAEQKLKAVSPDKIRAFFMDQVLACARGTEQIAVGNEQASWYDASFLEDANKALLSIGKPGALHENPVRMPEITGLVLMAQGTEVHCTFESILDATRNQIEAEIAIQLFSA